jgi:thioredoxin reductase/SAM-dependent methyltransferase
MDTNVVGDEAEMGDEMVDVVIVGGGAAGLSAALNLGRVRRSVVVIDAGEPRNAPAAHMHGYLGHEDLSPLELLRIGREEVATYGARVVEARAVGVTGDVDRGFSVALADGGSVRGRRLLVTSGLVDELPDIAGLRDRWGRDVVHCPFCHGWEVRDRPLVVIGTNGLGGHAAQVFHTLSDDITVVVHDGAPPTEAEAADLAALGVVVRSGPVSEVVVDDDAVTGVRLADGALVPAGAVVARGAMVARSAVLESLGLHPAEHPMGRLVEADPMGATSVPGVWVAGNVTDLAANVVMSAAAGARTGGAIHADLLRAEIERGRADLAGGHDGPTHGHGHGHDHGHGGGHGPGPDVELDQAFWEDWYAQKEQIWSGNPNPHLVTDTADLTPGRALDIGAGEGADAIWLAEQGWEVTAVDIAALALDRGRAEATRREPSVAGRVDWLAADITRWSPTPKAYDLVTLQFVHLTSAERAVGFPGCYEAVAPGGTLLVVGHDMSDLDTSAGRWPDDDRFFTAEELAADLGDGWDVTTAESRPRTMVDAEGREITIHDAVLVARRTS